MDQFSEEDQRDDVGGDGENEGTACERGQRLAQCRRRTGDEETQQEQRGKNRGGERGAASEPMVAGGLVLVRN